MNCKKCNNSNIVFVEYLGAYDGILEINCKECGYREHKETGFEIINSKQEKEYGSMYFTLRNDKNEIVVAKDKYLLNTTEKVGNDKNIDLI